MYSPEVEADNSHDHIQLQAYLIGGKDSFQLQLLVSCQLDLKRRCILLQVLDPLCARDWKDIFSLDNNHVYIGNNHVYITNNHVHIGNNHV